MEVKTVFVDERPDECRNCMFVILGEEQRKDKCYFIDDPLPVDYIPDECPLEDEFLQLLRITLSHRKKDEHIEFLEKALKSSWEMTDIAEDAAQESYERLMDSKCPRKFKNQTEKWLRLQILELEGTIKELEKIIGDSRGEKQA